jgi:hypothetical protein
MFKRRDAISKTDKILRFMRCFEECIQSLTSNRQKSFPLAVSYQRSKIYFKIDDANNASSSSTSSSQDTNIYLFDIPLENAYDYFSILNNFEYLNSDHVIDKNTIEYFVSNGCIRVNDMWVTLLYQNRIRFNGFYAQIWA